MIKEDANLKKKKRLPNFYSIFFTISCKKLQLGKDKLLDTISVSILEIEIRLQKNVILNKIKVLFRMTLRLYFLVKDYLSLR